MERAFLDVRLDTSLSFYGLGFVDFEFTEVGIVLFLQFHFGNHLLFLLLFLSLFVKIFISKLFLLHHRLVQLFESFFDLLVLVI